MAGEDLVELKFRLYDGTDIGPNKYAQATTVATLKESILAQWPSGCLSFPSRRRRKRHATVKTNLM